LGEHWFLLSVASTILNGVRSYFTKYFVDGGMTSAAGRFVPPTVMMALCLPPIWLDPAPVADDMVFLLMSASLQGALFYVASLCRWEALRERTPAHVLFPIIQASTPMVVLLSAVLFGEWTTVRQPSVACGIVLSIAATYLLAEWPLGGGTHRRGVLLALTAMLASAGATLAAKFALVSGPHLNVFGFILVSNFTGVALSAVQARYAGDAGRLTMQDWLQGAILGVLNFGGLALFLEAMRWGELSMVASIGALSTLVPILLAAVIQRERLMLRQQATLWLSFVALLILAKAKR
jgi:drug/metabolite transporter (DMT)-like permease